jgi:hypothetical protein
VRSKVPYGTVSRIARGVSKDFGVLKVQRLADHLEMLDTLDGVAEEARASPPLEEAAAGT